MRIPLRFPRDATSARRWLCVVSLLIVPGLAMAFGSVGTCPPDFGALRETAERVRNPTARASALDFVRGDVALSVYRAGGLDAFIERQREVIAAWRAFPGDDLFEPDRAAMTALHDGAIEIARCVQRKGDPRRPVDRMDAANRDFAAVVAVQATMRDASPSSGSGVLVSPCHVLTSQHVVSGAGAPRNGQRATVMLGEVRQPRADFAERLDAEMVGFSRRYWPEAGIDHDWALLRLERRVDADYPSLPLMPRGNAPPGRNAFGAGGRELTVAGFPGEKSVEGGSLSTLWRHSGCHVLEAASPIGGWATTCAMNPGQSGGPVLADRGGKRWELVGLAAAMSSATRGIVPSDETDATRSNLVTPLVGETLEEIYRLIDTYSCSP